MIDFQKFTLNNGLTLLVHEDPDTPMAVFNILYKVGARNENPEKTGFAHLFEHLMFGGSKHIAQFDTALQHAGGNNNAFTTNDLTNYYDILPAHNLETAFWLESDRMRMLNINSNSLEVQRKVVIEEFKENYINQPYGNLWHELSALAFKRHPYQWPTIGKEISHIEKFSLEDVLAFYNQWYCPKNAILAVAGNVKAEHVLELTKKWFGDFEPGSPPEVNLEQEPLQLKPERKILKEDVPVPAICIAWHMEKRHEDGFYTAEIITDLLASGKSSRFTENLIKGKRLFSSLDAYVTGMLDNGLFIVEGKLAEGVLMEEAEAALLEELDKLRQEPVSELELAKVVNKTEASHIFSEVSLFNRAMSLAFFEMLGNPDLANTEIEKYKAVNVAAIQLWAQRTIQPNNSSTLIYEPIDS